MMRCHYASNASNATYKDGKKVITLPGWLDMGSNRFIRALIPPLDRYLNSVSPAAHN